jgi:enamine deaminase RidA (YjgF/YER057c/UK114 family)
MPAQPIRKVSEPEIGYSVADLAGARHILAAAVGCRGKSLAAQVRGALEAIEAAGRGEGAPGSVVRQTVFVADADQIPACRQIVRDFYGPEMPATGYIPQPPGDGRLVAVEALSVGGEVQIQRRSPSLVILQDHGMSWIHCGRVVPRQSGRGVHDDAQAAFKELGALLAEAGVGLDRVLRTWLYLGGITESDGAGSRYQELNRARSEQYRDVSFLADSRPPGCPRLVYPASTGIGTAGRGVLVSAIALDTARDDVLTVPVENPRQTAAYEYAACYGPETPKFSRAMAVTWGGGGVLFVSGTASITHSETRHVGDFATQTHETLDNIAALVADENLARHGLPGLGTTLDGLAQVRVYVKRPADCAAARAICAERLRDVPEIYAVADVCRSELLVEIEAFGFCRPTG